MAADLSRAANFFCVIDEVDSILIDEARTPLIISGQVERPQEVSTGGAGGCRLGSCGRDG